MQPSAAQLPSPATSFPLGLPAPFRIRRPICHLLLLSPVSISNLAIQLQACGLSVFALWQPGINLISQ